MPNPNLDVVTVIKPNHSIWPLTPSEFWKWREAFYRLILKEFQVRFRDTYLGVVWVILQPVIALGVLYLVLMNNQQLGPQGIPYPVYILSGLVFWMFISNGMIQGSLSLIENRALITQTNLKRSLIPLSILCSKLIDLGFGVLFLMAWIVLDPSVSMHMNPLMVLLDILGILFVLTGIIFGFSALCIQYKDIRYIIPFLTQILFFASPIIYMLPESKYQWILYLNPFTVFLLSIRDHFLGTSFVQASEYALTFAFSLVIFILGGVIFRKFEKSFADLI